MPVTDALGTVAFVVIALLAAVSDVRTRRIPNRLTVTGLAVFLLLRAPLGWHSLLQGVEGAALGLGIGLALFMLGGLGAGDAKLLAAVGAFFGPSEFFGAFAITAVVGAVFALVDAARRGVLLLLFLQLVDVGGYLRSATRGDAAGRVTSGSLRLPYGVPIAIGGIVWKFAGAAIMGALFT
ncbi:MAG TPA: prepilin peptidase [Gemmatimonadales bacterium]|nr:prepilin peptidase [Gemmatimonadales bacterium]